ncbi:MAG: phosphoribosylanthranilate isomerase [Verrucomicrobiales bacterium]|nr:phosphoribosylanthranilate isomerase [Verrucomicrobiales bacterium]MCP5556263.1 phosphoribosylanthranilate isomerase [Verrucomicrobiaceae bacterium]
MFPNPDRPSVKICGITQAHQAREIIAAGADAIGINFWSKSKRYLPPQEAAKWVPALKPDTTVIAVLVNPEADLLRQITEAGLVHALQFHGDESPEEIAEWMDSGFQIIKALQVRDAASLDQIGTFPCTDILLDAYNPGLYGGEGVTFPWDLALQAKERFPLKRIWLSGGLTPDNVNTAIQQVQPAAVDVASGVEGSPGIKDLEKVRRFISEARRT